MHLIGLSQPLAQSTLEVFSPNCRADLGDHRCKFPIQPPELERDQTVSAGAFYRVPTAAGTGSARYEDRISAVLGDVVTSLCERVGLMRTRYGPGVSIPTTDGAEIEALGGSNPSFAAWEQNEPYTIALLIKGRSGGASTKHLYRSGTSSTADHILWLSSGTTPNLRHQASGGGTVTITSSVAIVNDTTWSTIVGTWRPGRLELYVDGWSRASSTAAATNTSALFGIYRWGWGFSTSQDFNGDIALIACFASSWTPAMVRRWHADPFGFLRPWNEVPALMGSAPPATPPSTGTGVVTFLMG